MAGDDTKVWAIARRLPHEAPLERELAHAPVIDNWRLVAIGEHLVITGTVAGSPKFRDGSSIRTSALKGIERLRPQWAVTQNSIYRLGIPYDEGKSLLVRAALERDWPSAAQVIVDAIGTHTLRLRESTRAASLQGFVAQPPAADDWTERRHSARELAEALSQAGREAAAGAVWLLSVDADDRQQITSAHAFLAGDASSLVTPDDEVQRTIDNWKALADGHQRGDLTDLIAAAHRTDGTNAARDGKDPKGPANEPPLFVQMALQRTWWDAADLALAVTPNAIPDVVGPWTRGEGPHAELRAVALGLSAKFSAAEQHDLEFLWRLLSIDPRDRVAALWVAEELQVLVRAAAIPGDLAWTLEATRATIAWEMLATAGSASHPNDAFASAWSIYSAKAIPMARLRSEQAPDDPLLLRIARQRTWTDAAEIALRASPADVAAAAREQGLLSADPVERLRVATQIAGDLYTAGDQNLGHAWLMVSTNANDKSAIAIFAEKLEALASSDDDKHLANAWWRLADEKYTPHDGHDLFCSVWKKADRLKNAEPDETRENAAGVSKRTGVVVLPGIGGTSRSSSSKEVTLEFKGIIGQELELVPATDLARVRAVLRDEFPHLQAQLDVLLTGLVEGEAVRLPPTLLVGEPGGGKSRLARRFAELMTIGLHRFDGGGSSDNAFGGMPRRWSTGEHCIPLEAVRRHRIANPILLVDEVDKAGNSRHNGSLDHALLPFLERENARAYPDPYVQSDVDLSHVNYILTANDDKALPAPLRDRLRIIRLPHPSIEDLPVIARGIVADIAKERGGDPRWWPPLEDHELAIAEVLWRGGSLRRLRAIVERLLAHREQNPRN